MNTIESVYEKPASIEDGYVKVCNLIYHQVHKFTRMYGGDFNELLGEANELFVRGHQQYEDGVTHTGRVLNHDYATQIRRWVWFGMFDSMRMRLAHNKKAIMVPLEGHDVAKEVTPEFALDEFVGALSDDARLVARLILDPPEEVFEIIMAKGGTPRNYRSTVKATLLEGKWNSERINDAFEEIAIVLG